MTSCTDVVRGARQCASVVGLAVANFDGENDWPIVSLEFFLLRRLLGKGANSFASTARGRAMTGTPDELQSQSELLHVTLASIGDAVISTNAQGNVVFLNGVAEWLTG